jgi:hypothetical protein
MDLLRSLEKCLFGFDSLGILHARLRRAGSCAHLLFVVTDTFGAKHGIDDEDVVPHGDCAIGALVFASPTVDAVVYDCCRHIGPLVMTQLRLRIET